MNMSKYVLLKKGVADKGRLVSIDKYEDLIDDNEKDFYVSTYHFNESHVKQFKELGTIKGITDVTTDKLWFDFDSKDNLDLSKKDAVELCDRLQKAKIAAKDIEVYFSSGKGFHVIVTTKRVLTPELVASICLNKFGKGLETLDASIYDAVRVLRVPGTKNKNTNLYKIPLTVKELTTLSVADIKTKAKSLDNITEHFNWTPTDIPEEMFELPKPEKKFSVVTEMNVKPSNWRSCKWNILQGNFKSGDRHNALMVLASTARGMGFDKDTAYYMCKSALKKQAAITGTEEFDKEELYKNIIEDSVFTDSWEGGQYTCQKPGFLQKYCQGLGEHACKAEGDELANVVHIDETFGMFKSYAQNIDKITIKTGIPALDKHVRMTIGMSVGIVAAPSSGKTSIALQMLNQMSKSGTKCLFFSYDMYHSLVFQKLIQKHFQISSDTIFKKFQECDPTFEAEVLKVIKQEYGNVDFCFKQGQTIEDISRTIKEAEQKSGEKIRFIVIDYNELISTPYSDSTASSSFTAQKIRELAIVHECCILSLYQPNKMSGGPQNEINSYVAAKGSSAIQQALSVMFGLSRPGFDPRDPDNDRYMTISCLKNRMGNNFSVDLHWDGLKGTVRDLSSEERGELAALKERKKLESESSCGGWS